jgi:hypothetical protein
MKNEKNASEPDYTFHRKPVGDREAGAHWFYWITKKGFVEAYCESYDVRKA